MQSDYKQIITDSENHQHYLTFTGNEKSVSVYLNGKRLFLGLDYTIFERMVTLNTPVEVSDLLIVSYS